MSFGTHGNDGNGIYSYNSCSNKLEHVAQYLDNKDSGNQSYYSECITFWCFENNVYWYNQNIKLFLLFLQTASILDDINPDPTNCTYRK